MSMNTAHWFWSPAIMIAAGFLLLPDTVMGWAHPLVTVLFLSICPGMSCLMLFGMMTDDVLAAWALALATSLALELVLATAMLCLGIWRPDAALLIVIGLTCILTVIGFLMQLVLGRVENER